MGSSAIRTQIQGLIDTAVEEAKAREEEEKATGKVLQDDPVARLVEPPRALEDARPRFSPNVEWAETIRLGLPEVWDTKLVRINYSHTTYLTARRQWRAWKAANKLLPDPSDTEVLFELFHILPGVLGWVTVGDEMLVGIRSAKIAGTHSGMVSIPGGLMKPKEQLEDALKRQLDHETGVTGEYYAGSTFAYAWNPDAPNITFCTNISMRRAPQLGTTWEAKGKTFQFVAQEAVRTALQGNMSALEEKLGETNLKFAPDAADCLKQLM